MSNSILESVDAAGDSTADNTGDDTVTNPAGSEPATTVMSMQQALNRALDEVLAENPKAVDLRRGLRPARRRLPHHRRAAGQARRAARL